MVGPSALAQERKSKNPKRALGRKLLNTITTYLPK